MGTENLAEPHAALGSNGKRDVAKQCPNCRAKFPADMRFCPQDATPLEDLRVLDEAEKPANKKPEPAAAPKETADSLPELPSLDESNDEPISPSDTCTTLNTSGTPPLSNLADPRLELIGQVVEERYEVTETLGKGGMSVVFKGRDRRLKKVVAIKVLMPHLSADPMSVQRFQQEATAASHLDHPNIVKVYNVGATASGLPFMAMDYLEGRSLSTVIKEKGRLEYFEALNIFVQLTGALAHAHEKGVIHRDLKPSNVILSSHGEETDVAKLVDFGIAKVLSQDGHTQAKLTQTGDIFGSPHYMSPEQCLGGELDERSDIYSMGCLMYEALTGRPPHTGDSTLQILHKHISETPASFKSLLPSTSTSMQLELIVFKCLAPKRDDRVQNMRQLKSELSKLYMNRENDVIKQSLGRLSLAWSKRPKLSRREKFLAATGLVVSVTVLLSIWLGTSFVELTTKSPWLSSDILTWIPPKPPAVSMEDKVSIAYSQIDLWLNRRDELLKEGAVKPGEMVRGLTNAGLGLEQSGRLEEAARTLKSASEIARDHISKYSTLYVGLLFLRGRVDYELGRYNTALKHLKGALESGEWPVGNMTKGECESMIADCYNFLGKRDAAEDYYERAIERWKQGSESPRYPINAARYGDLVLPYKTPESSKYAFDLYKSARKRWSQNADTEGQNIALCSWRMSDTLASLGEKERAIELLQQANQELALAVGKDSPKRAALMLKYADELWNQGKRLAAIQQRFECWQILQHAPPPVTTHAI